MLGYMVLKFKYQIKLTFATTRYLPTYISFGSGNMQRSCASLLDIGVY